MFVSLLFLYADMVQIGRRYFRGVNPVMYVRQLTVMQNNAHTRSCMTSLLLYYLKNVNVTYTQCTFPIYAGMITIPPYTNTNDIIALSTFHRCCSRANKQDHICKVYIKLQNDKVLFILGIVVLLCSCIATRGYLRKGTWHRRGCSTRHVWAMYIANGSTNYVV